MRSQPHSGHARQPVWDRTASTSVALALRCALMPGSTSLATTLLMLEGWGFFMGSEGGGRASVSLPLRSLCLFQEEGIEPSEMF